MFLFLISCLVAELCFLVLGRLLVGWIWRKLSQTRTSAMPLRAGGPTSVNTAVHVNPRPIPTPCRSTRPQPDLTYRQRGQRGAKNVGVIHDD